MSDDDDVGLGDVTLPRKRVRGDTVEERLTDNAVEHVLPARYLLRDETGAVVETPAELFERVADAVANTEDEPERWRSRFHELLTGLEFVPNSPTLMNAGGQLGQLSACFVMSPEDDLDDIFETVRRAARVFQSGGGVGYAYRRALDRGCVGVTVYRTGSRTAQVLTTEPEETGSVD